MIKRLLLVLFLLGTITGYSQSRRPKSTKKPTIQDVITEKKTPEEILKEVYKARLDSASQFSYTCMQYLVETKVELDSVKKVNQTLYVLIDRQLDTLVELHTRSRLSSRLMLKEHYRKRAWIKVCVGETILVAGAIGIFVTGAWVPIGMAVATIEIFLILEGKYSNVDLKDKKQKRLKF
jgi:hypothetical protein